MHVAARPSPPYRTWVRDNIAPVTWDIAVNHSDKVLSRLVTSRRAPPTFTEASSSSTQRPPGRSVQDQFCQTVTSEMTHRFCQTETPVCVDVEISPDLIHLETTLVLFRSVEFYHPPWPIVWVQVVDEFGVIRDTIWTMPTPIEEEILVNQYPPETNHETGYVYPSDPPTVLPPRRPFGRPPPPPFPRPEPPTERPGYFPTTRGIRAVFTTGAALLRSQPEMNHPRRPIAPRIRDGVNALSDWNVVEIAQQWTRRTNENPEINPNI